MSFRLSKMGLTLGRLLISRTARALVGHFLNNAASGGGVNETRRRALDERLALIFCFQSRGGEATLRCVGCGRFFFPPPSAEDMVTD